MRHTGRALEMTKDRNNIKFEKVKLERTPCYGSCPVYTVEVFADGRVKYNGKIFVARIGIHEWNIDEKSIEEINNAIAKYGYFSMKENEPTLIATCSSSCITFVLLQNGLHREINNYHGEDRYPIKLQRFEDKIDEIICIAEYVGNEL